MRRTEPKIKLFVGLDDIVVFWHQDKVVVGVCTHLKPIKVSWGDIEMESDGTCLFIASKTSAKPSLGEFIGKSFDSEQEAVNALRPHTYGIFLPEIT